MTDFLQRLESLNPQQYAAATAGDGPLLVVAGAGTGKTRVITHRIAWLIHERQVAPWQIFAATFTNKAAGEMAARVGQLVPGAELGRLTISTFHSICVGILRRESTCVGLSPRFSICDDTDQKAVVKDSLARVGGGVATVRPEQALGWISQAKIRMLDPAGAQRELPDETGQMGQVYHLYQERLRTNDAVDFDDLIGLVVRIFQESPDVLGRYQERWRYIMVDEYQDTNRVQFELVHLLGSGHGNVCVVGDEDQSIYSWRGAEIENLLSFPDLFPGTQVVRLEQNYRSTETILAASNAVIEHNHQRNEKRLWSDRGVGEAVTMVTGFNERDEAAQVVETIYLLKRRLGRPYRDMAIFYRVNALSRVFEDQLRQRGIPYRVIGGIRFYDRAEVKDLISYLRLCLNPRDGIALDRVINKPPRGIGAKSLAAIFDHATRRAQPVWESLRAIVAKDPEAPKVSGKARAGIADLVDNITKWAEYAEDRPPNQVLERILRDTGYEDALGPEGDLQTLTRRENIGELVSALEEYHEANPGDGLGGFLERVALVNATDDITDEDTVSLMTLHCAKGLEYGAVFMVGMEDPIFPSGRAVEETGHFEEERRLFYVGITRARDLLFLSRADSRLLYGRPCYNTPSLFLREVPTELMRSLDDARQHWADVLNQRAAEGSGSMREHEHGGSGPAGAEREEVARGPGSGDSNGSARRTAEAIEVSTGIFAVGDRVRHERLGEGEVITATGAGDKRKVSVRFDAGLELEILEIYGGLTPVEDDDGDLPY